VVRAHALLRRGKLAALVEGVDDRDVAATLAGAEIYVERAQLPAPADGEYYWVDLEGLAVANADGVELGRVERVFATGANDVLVVRDHERERLIPFVQGDFVKAVDIDAGRIIVDWDADF
jgi:16S rRNA processing protein RimM